MVSRIGLGLGRDQSANEAMQDGSTPPRYLMGRYLQMRLNHRISAALTGLAVIAALGSVALSPASAESAPASMTLCGWTPVRSCTGRLIR